MTVRNEVISTLSGVERIGRVEIADIVDPRPGLTNELPISSRRSKGLPILTGRADFLGELREGSFEHLLSAIA